MNASYSRHPRTTWSTPFSASSKKPHRLARSPQTCSRQLSHNRPNHYATNRSQESVEVEGLREYLHPLQFRRPPLLIADSRQDKNRNRGPHRVSAALREELPSVHDRHIKIENDPVNGCLRMQVGKSVETITRIPDVVSHVRQQQRHRIAEIVVIVHEENSRSEATHKPMRIHERLLKSGNHECAPRTRRCCATMLTM